MLKPPAKHLTIKQRLVHLYGGNINFMKIKLSYLLAVASAFLFISCSNHPYENQKQPAPDTSEMKVVSKTSAPTKPANTVSTKPEVKSKYKYPDDNGIGPVKNVKLGSIDPKLIAAGKKIFTTKCMACHRMDTRLVGPPLRNITKKNTPEFIMNYLLNTAEMQKKDPILMKLVEEYKIIMPDQQLTKKDARSVLEYFRSTEK